MLRWKERVFKVGRLFQRRTVQQCSEYCEYINPYVARTIDRNQQQAAYIIERTLDEMYKHQAGMNFSRIEADRKNPNVIVVSFEGTENQPYRVNITCPAWMKELKKEAANRLRS
jgi:hypothetical protein